MSSGTITFFVGGSTSFNTYCTLRNIGNMIGDAFDLHLVATSDELGGQLSNTYDVFGGAQSPGPSGDVRALRRYFSTVTPDVVANLIGAPRYGTLISLLKPAESTFVCRFSGENFETFRVVRPRRKLPLFLYRNVLGRFPLHTADQLVTMGPREKRRLVDRHVPADRVSILPPPVDPDRLANPVGEPPFDTSHGRSIALFVGRVSQLKGIGTLEAAIPEVLDRRADMQFVVIGAGHDHLSIPRRYADRIEVVGPVDPSSIPASLDVADVLVHPSLTEGVSRSVVEALLAGTPVVVRDVGDLAYATNNIYTTDDEFVNMLCEWEDLAVDDARKFTTTALREKYSRFFTKLV